MPPERTWLAIPNGARYPTLSRLESFDAYAQVYYSAATMLWKSADKNHAGILRPNDNLVMPILYLLHHFVELELKEVINLTASVGSLTGVKVEELPDSTHDLRQLLRVATANLDALGHGDSPLSEEARNIILGLEQFSPHGEAFRYPSRTIRQGGMPTMPESFVVDMPPVMNAMNNCWHEFAGRIGFLDNAEQMLFDPRPGGV